MLSPRGRSPRTLRYIPGRDGKGDRGKIISCLHERNASASCPTIHPVSCTIFCLLLWPGGPQEMFQDSNVDPAAFDAMDYAQKRLLLLKSSKVAFAPSTNGGEESDEEDDEPAILTMQNSAQWPSVR